MNKIAKLIADGKITVEELKDAQELIERAELVIKGVEACKKTLKFPLGEEKLNCYKYVDSFGEYEAWGTCTNTGIFTCHCNWGGTHQIGTCNLTDFNEVFLAFENSEFSSDLKRFLLEQIEKAKNE